MCHSPTKLYCLFYFYVVLACFNYDKIVYCQSETTEAQSATTQIRISAPSSAERVASESIAVKADKSTETMRAIHITEYGGPENLAVVEDVPKPWITADQILVKVQATAINRADTLQRKGRLGKQPGPWRISGLECAGTVEEVGETVDTFKLGDRVMALLPGGGYSQYVPVNANHAMAVPGNLNFTEAAAIPEVWLTAYQLLYFVGGFRAGDTVVIHAAGSGVGTAATQIVSQNGGTVIAVAGTDEKLAFAKQLGAQHTINYNQQDFAVEVQKHTRDKGATLILDCVGGSNWQKNVASLAVDGRWVLYGLLGGGQVEGEILRQLLMKRVSLLCSLLKPRSDQYKAELVEAFSKHGLLLFSSGAYRPIIDSVLKLESVSQAHTRMESNLNVGKIVLTVDHDDTGDASAAASGGKDEL